MDYDDYDPGYRDFPYENSGDPAFCDGYEAHEAHAYRAVNGNTYSCPGLSAEDMAALEAEANQPSCEHGLSQSLCAGPGHYPMD